MGGEVKFVLGGSGHIAGIINPPRREKYGYWTNESLPEQPDEWHSGARRNSGSWWLDRAVWMEPHGAGKVPARQPGLGLRKAIEKALGSYVKVDLQ